MVRNMFNAPSCTAYFAFLYRAEVTVTWRPTQSFISALPQKECSDIDKKVESSFLLPRLAFKLGLHKNCRQSPFSSFLFSSALYSIEPGRGNAAVWHYSRSNPVRPTSTTPLPAWYTVINAKYDNLSHFNFSFPPICYYYVVSMSIMAQFSSDKVHTN